MITSLPAAACWLLWVETADSMAALGLELNSERYVELLRKLIGEVECLQNNPPRFIPQEDK